MLAYRRLGFGLREIPELAGDPGADAVAHQRRLLWSVTAKDYATTDTALVEKRVLDGVRCDGIILLHERYAGTILAVPDIIRRLRDQECILVTVPQLMAPAKPGRGGLPTLKASAPRTVTPGQRA